MEFVDRIDLKLKEKNLKRVAMCEDIGIDTSIMTAWNKRGTIPSAEVVLKIANYLDVSMEWLITGKEADGLSEEEADLVRKYRTLDARDRNAVAVLLNALCGK